MADLELNPNLNIHENGSNHGQTPDLHLNIHEIGSIHGQTPIRTSQSKPQFDDFYYIGENRAFRRECHIRCTESSARRHPSGDCCKMHRTSGRGGQSLAEEGLKKASRAPWNANPESYLSNFRGSLHFEIPSRVIICQSNYSALRQAVRPEKLLIAEFDIYRLQTDLLGTFSTGHLDCQIIGESGCVRFSDCVHHCSESF